MKNTSKVIGTEKKLRPVPPPPAPAPAAPPAWRTTPRPPHPLDLNRHESRWQHYCNGPINGWFSFGEHGNPPFNVPVQLVALVLSEPKKNEPSTVQHICVGIRSPEIDPGAQKERWIVHSQFEMRSLGLTHWRFLSPPP